MEDMPNGQHAKTADITIKALLVIVGILAGSGGSWLIGRDFVTKSEALDLIETNAPYIQDRRALSESLQAIKDGVGNNGRKVDELGDSLRARVSGLETRVTQLEVKMDLLLEKQ